MGNIEKFDLIANQYDTPERIEIAKIIADTIRTYVVNGKEKSAVDYGCGTGLIGMQLLDVFNSTLFIDASNSMVEQVNRKLGQLQGYNVNALCCDLVKEHPPNLHADYVIMVQALLHIKELELILLNLYSVLNNGGHLIIVDFNKNNAVVSPDVHNGFEQEMLINLLKRIGYIHSNARTFYHGKKIFMNNDASLFILDSEK